MAGRPKSSLSADELSEYTNSMKLLANAEKTYNLSTDQLSGSLLVMSIVYDIDLDEVKQDYRLLTDKEIS